MGRWLHSTPLATYPPRSHPTRLAHSFAQRGQVKDAVRFLSSGNCKGILKLESTVVDDADKGKTQSFRFSRKSIQ